MKLIPFVLLCFAIQDQAPGPTFEVASIRPATQLGPLGMRAARNGGPGTRDPARYTCQNCPVFWVLSEAYDLQPWQYVGPDWVHNVRFDFAANVPAGTIKEDFRAMLVNLLTERFHLAAHREKREMPLYELTVASNGPKIRESPAQDAAEPEAFKGNLQRDNDGFPILPRGTTMAAIPGHARIRSDHQPIGWFARMLSGQLQSPVLDSTGLHGNYDFLLSWAFEEDSAQGSAMLDTYRPALIDAVQSQLGLKLQSKKGPVEVLVIDHLDKEPVGN
ncbi:MAG TPA: TIGR03435 family protein [Bryobacteraceae bacterium]|nr:TIGR03435 family protein [Bryobacteraceae bacterium]